jgi:hypothetical protein
MRIDEQELYAIIRPDAEIGRWLATKNVTERVGDILFMHGGISQYVNMMNISLTQLNDL